MKMNLCRQIVALAFVSAIMWLCGNAILPGTVWADNHAVLFNGVDAYAEIPNTPALRSESFTVAFWLKAHAMKAQLLAAKIDGLTGNGWRIHIDSPDGETLRFESVPGNIGRLQNDFSHPVEPDKWIHVSAVYDASDNIARLYVNGTLNDEETDIPEMGGITGDGVIRLGHIPGKNPFDGIIDEFGIWNRALTEKQIRRFMRIRPQTGDEGLAGYWAFDEGAGAIAHDRINDNDAVLETGNPTWLLSSVPMGEGTGVIVGCDADDTILFPGTRLSFHPDQADCRPYMVSRIDSVPNQFPAGTMESGYWIIETFDGGGSYVGDFSFDMEPNLLGADDAAHPEQVLLYRRDANSHGRWTVAAAAARTSPTGRVDFEGVEIEGQLILTRRGRGTALTLDGLDDYAAASNLPVDLDAFTLEVWIFHETEIGANEKTLPDRTQRYITLEPDVVMLRHAGKTQPGQLEFQLLRAGGGPWGIRLDDVLQPDQWHHVAGVWDGETMKLYLDGVLEESVLFGEELAAMNGRIKISDMIETMRGNIEDVRIWRRARTAEEIRSTLYRPLKGDEQGLVAYWPFPAEPSSAAATYDGAGAYELRVFNNQENAWVPSDAPIPLRTRRDGKWGESGVWAHGDAAPLAGDWVSVGHRIVVSESARIQNLDIEQGGVLVIEVPAVLTVGDTVYAAGESTGGGAVRLHGESQVPHRIGGQLQNLEIDHPFGAVLFDDLTITGRLNLVQGNIALNGHDIRLSPEAIMEESDSGRVIGVTGMIEIDRFFDERDLSRGENIGGLGLHVETVAALGDLIIVRKHEPLKNGNMTGIGRSYDVDIQPEYNDDLDAALVFHYADAELNGNAEEMLTLFRSSDGGETWTPLDGELNATTNTITVESVDTLGRFTAFSQFEGIGAELPVVGAEASGACAAWGDYDRDGDLDLIMAGPGLPYGGIFENKGENGFEDIGVALFDMGTLRAGCSLSWGDFDNDGRLDVLAAGKGGTRIFRNSGDNIFIDIGAKLPALGDNIPAGGALPAHLNGDGELDVVLSGGDFLGVFFNNGDGTFSRKKAEAAGLPTEISAFPLHTATADFNGDGAVDLLLAGERTSGIYLNDGEGGFAESKEPVMNPDPSPLAGIGYSPFGVGAAVCDYNNDGRPDILLAGGDATYIYRNDTGGGEVAFSPIEAALPAAGPVGSGRHVAWGDYDNDGRSDILLAGENFSRIYRNNDDGSFSDMHVMLPAMVSGDAGGSAVWGDMDGDGDVDALLAGNRFSRIYRNNWNGFDAAPLPPTGLISVSEGTGTVRLSWRRPEASDSGNASYNVRVGRSSGGGQAMSAMAKPNGWRLVPRIGNAGRILGIRIGGLAKGFYYWSVQSVDSSYVGSDFAQESYFIIDCLAPVVSETRDKVMIVFDPGCAAREIQRTGPVRENYEVRFSRSALGANAVGKEELDFCDQTIEPENLDVPVECDDAGVVEGKTYAYYTKFIDLYNAETEFGPVYATVGAAESITRLGRAVQVLKLLCGLPLDRGLLLPPESPSSEKPGLATVIWLLRQSAGFP